MFDRFFLSSPPPFHHAYLYVFRSFAFPLLSDYLSIQSNFHRSYAVDYVFCDSQNTIPQVVCVFSLALYSSVCVYV